MWMGGMVGGRRCGWVDWWVKRRLESNHKKLDATGATTKHSTAFTGS